MRHALARLCATAVVLASCGSPAMPTASTSSAGVVPTAAASSTAGATGVPTAAPTATAQPATPAPITTGRWEATGSMALGRLLPNAVLLGDGSVLVVGNDDQGCVRADSVRSEIWQAAGGTWTAGPSLPKPRAEFAAAALTGGGALVTGGVNAGTNTAAGPRHQAYSSTYVFGTGNSAEGWARSGLLGTARVTPSAVSLQDGRVLVLGGYYVSGSESGTGSAATAALAAWRPGPAGTAPEPAPDDVSPGVIVPALATAELYDPASGTWSATGSMRFARFDAPAVTLADGRVLVAGSEAAGNGENWRYTEWDAVTIRIDDRATTTAEIFDPRSGRFSLQALPPMDWSSIADLGPAADQEQTSPGVLVATADGGAVLVGQGITWHAESGDDYVQAVRTLRFDPASGAWTTVDQRIFVYGPDRTPVERGGGHSREGALVALLADGHVLVAGGQYFIPYGVATDAELYDPASNTWTELPPMTQPRAWGTAVTLPDGTVLLVGGDDRNDGTRTGNDACRSRAAGLATTVRFMPGS